MRKRAKERRDFFSRFLFLSLEQSRKTSRAGKKKAKKRSQNHLFPRRKLSRALSLEKTREERDRKTKVMEGSESSMKTRLVEAPVRVKFKNGKRKSGSRKVVSNDNTDSSSVFSLPLRTLFLPVADRSLIALSSVRFWDTCPFSGDKLARREPDTEGKFLVNQHKFPSLFSLSVFFLGLEVFQPPSASRLSLSLPLPFLQ